MAWTTPPTFADGDYLAAANLNILSDDIEHLRAQSYQVNTGFPVHDLTPGDGSTSTASKWAVKHFSNTFRYWMVVTLGTMDAVRIKFGATTIFNDAADRSNPYTYIGTIDISSYGFTANTVYDLTVEADGEPGSANNTLRVYYLGEDW